MTAPPCSSVIECPGSNGHVHRWPQRVLTICAAFVGLGLSGCMSVRLEELRHAATQLRANEAVVLLGRPHIDGKGVEPSFLNCLHSRLDGATLATVAAPAGAADSALRLGASAAGKVAANAARLQLFPRREFTDAFYPWLEPSTVPTDGAGLEKFLSLPGVREQVTSMGVRYIVWVDGATEKTDGGGNVTCGIIGGGAGCFGIGWWQKKANYEATVWDLESGTGAGNVSASVNGFSVVVAFVVPVPLIAPVQGAACRRLSAQLQAFLRNETYH